MADQLDLFVARLLFWEKEKRGSSYIGVKAPFKCRQIASSQEPGPGHSRQVSALTTCKVISCVGGYMPT